MSTVTVVVCHPDDTVAARAAAERFGMSPVEVAESRSCPPGTAYTFPKDDNPLWPDLVEMS